MTETTTAQDRAEAEGAGETAQRGLEHLRHPMVWGGLIGCIGGGAFMLGNAPGLPEGWSLAATLLGWLLLAAALAAVLLLPRHLPALERPERRALAVYAGCVVAMLLLLPVTRWIAVALGVAEAQPALVAAVVGGHFIPFAVAFHAPVFRRMGWLMVIVGLVGAVLAAAVHLTFGPAAAVAAGAVMLIVVALQALAGRSRG